jgi:hypothetical protein
MVDQASLCLINVRGDRFPAPGHYVSTTPKWRIYMKVHVDNLDVAMELGNNGIVLSVYDNDNTYKGKFRVGKGTVEWCKGKKHLGNGKKVNWNDLISYFEED